MQINHLILTAQDLGRRAKLIPELRLAAGLDPDAARGVLARLEIDLQNFIGHLDRLQTTPVPMRGAFAVALRAEKLACYRLCILRMAENLLQECKRLARQLDAEPQQQRQRTSDTQNQIEQQVIDIEEIVDWLTGEADGVSLPCPCAPGRFGEACPLCRAAEGQFHIPGCKWKRCPLCELRGPCECSGRNEAPQESRIPVTGY